MKPAKVLVICGPTATGKTKLGLDLARQFNGEIISADSRQVYKHMDIVTGKDIPPEFQLKRSQLSWQENTLEYFTDGSIRIWLTGVVNPDFQFSVSCFQELANLVITDIHSRGKLPIIVGSTGLYIKSLTHNLNLIHIPPDWDLRNKLCGKPAARLFSLLEKIAPSKAAQMNNSDRGNPSRLIRAIEIALHPDSPRRNLTTVNRDFFQLCLYGPRPVIYDRINRRVEERICAGALAETTRLLSAGYSWDLKSLRTTGYRVWRPYLEKSTSLDSVKKAWQTGEHHDFKSQLAWFRKQPGLNWVDVTHPNWEAGAFKSISSWLGN